jgi:polysaccharide biosynthesis transport protein
MAQFLKLSTTPSDQDPGIVEPVGVKVPRLDEIVPHQVQVTPENRIVFHTAPETPGADRIRYLRMHLRRMREAKGLKTVLITSPVAGDGKSTLAMNLATALTEEGKFRVLLIEADLHHASLAPQLGLTGCKEGLVDCLERDVHPLTVIRRLDPLGWYLLPAGEVRKPPAELLHTSAYEHVIKALAGTFDWILVDSPPVVAVSDALFLRQHSDATLLVVRAGHTPQTSVDEAIRQLGRQHIAAVVLNAVEGLDRMYHKYGNKYYGAGKPSKSVPD